ncbi:hypothetical protein ACHAW5_003031 [Stephanodiscus triporus]|uniref:UAA transporter n=1 Tax=Stephanodiscus triporus TaxID=2934178 RepID=A0ABD3NPT0_9STRA
MLDSLPPTHQMALVGFLMFLFFGMHNVLQEAIVNLLNVSASEGGGGGGDDDAGLGGTSAANRTFMLGYAEVLGVLVFSYLERSRLTTEGGTSRVAPLSAYPMLTLCLFASSSMSNLSLGYINFPTKVVFRSCKLVPTMIIATVVNSRRFKPYEYLCALSICAGLVLFAMADYALDPLQFHPAGLLLVSGSVVADAILPNAQERLFKDGSSRLEVTVYSNFFIFVGMTIVTVGNGTLPQFGRVIRRDGTLALYFAAYTVLSYASISCYMTLVKRFGGVTAVVLTTARKAMTLVLSFVLFPKGFSWMYVHGSLLVLSAVMMASICKKMGIGGKKGPSSSSSSSGEKVGGGGYSLVACRNDDRDVESRGGGIKKSRVSAVPSSFSSTAASCGFSSLGESQLEKLVASILEGISKRAYT